MSSTSIRSKLDHWLNTVWVQTSVVVVVFLDLLLLLFLLLIDQDVIQEPPSSSDASSSSDVTTSPQDGGFQKAESVQHAEDALHITQIVILSLFLVEILLRVLAKGFEILEDKLQIFDGIVVLVTFTLYIALSLAAENPTVTYAIGYIISLRLWRMHRIYKALTETIVRRAERIIIAHRKAWKHTEDRLRVSQMRLDKSRKEVDQLKVELEVAKRQATRGPNSLTSSHSQPCFSTADDLLTSEDEFSSGTPVPRSVPSQRRVPAEVNSQYARRTPNGRVPNGTPKGSVGSAPNGSVPGTPQSTGSYDMFYSDNMDSAGSDTRVPDIVEDAQSADRSRSETPVNGLLNTTVRTLQETAIIHGQPDKSAVYDKHLDDSGIMDNTSHHQRPESHAGSQPTNPVHLGQTVPAQGVGMPHSVNAYTNNSYGDVMPGDITNGGYEITTAGNLTTTSGKITSSGNPSPYGSEAGGNTRNGQANRGQSELIMQPSYLEMEYEPDASDSLRSQSKLLKASGASEAALKSVGASEATLKSAASTQGSLASLGSVILRRKRNKSGDENAGKLIAVQAGTEFDVFTYENVAFDDLTEEEKKEIYRISQVPFGSTSHLTMQGIPMTDL